MQSCGYIRRKSINCKYFCNSLAKQFTICAYCIYTVREVIVIIQLNNQSDKPIYEQITEQLKRAILDGRLPAGHALPSIRALATELNISVMTTKRAYADLERDGFIETIRGKGSYVTAQNSALLREQFIQQAEQHFLQGISLATAAKLSKDELLQLFEVLLEEDFNEEY